MADWHVRGGVTPVMYQGELDKDVRVWPGNNDSSLVDNIFKYDRVPSIPLYVPLSYLVLSPPAVNSQPVRQASIGWLVLGLDQPAQPANSNRQPFLAAGFYADFKILKSN